MAIETVNTWKNGALISSQEIVIPDPPAIRTPEYGALLHRRARALERRGDKIGALLLLSQPGAS